MGFGVIVCRPHMTKSLLAFRVLEAQQLGTHLSSPKSRNPKGGGLGLRVPLPRPLLIVLALAAGSHAHSFLDSNEVTENEARGMHVQQYCKRTSSSKNENKSNKHDNNRNFNYLMQCAKIIIGSAALSQQVQVVCRSIPSLHDTSVK